MTAPQDAARLADEAAHTARLAAAHAEEAARLARTAARNLARTPGETSLDEELLSSIWLYVSWRGVTRSLTTEQRERWADILDAAEARRHVEDGEPGAPSPIAERWWREEFIEPV